MPPEHVLDKRLLMYIQTYNLGPVSSVNISKCASKQRNFYALFFCCVEFLSVQENLWGKYVHILLLEYRLSLLHVP